MKLQGIHHVALIASDYARSRDFYTRILGLEVVAEHFRAERQSWKLDLRLPDGTGLELFSFPAPPPRPSRPEARGLRHLAFRVAALDAAIAHLPTPTRCRWSCTNCPDGDRPRRARRAGGRLAAPARAAVAAPPVTSAALPRPWSQ